MKNISFYTGKQLLIYPIVFGLYLFLVSAQARNPLGELKKFSLESLEQQQQVTGVVRDAKGVLPGVSITVKGKNAGGITNEKGDYLVLAKVTDTLVFSFVGYKTITIAVNNRSKIDVQLLEDLTALQEVVVNAGYYTVKESERTGSIVKITSKDIDRQPVANVLATMQGRMAGVNITQTTGVPGGGFDVQIRGQNSIRADGNSPLYIIDGIPAYSQSLGNSNLSAGILPSVSALNAINPSDIESIEILKDADATSIYGSRGSNGVVLITTKKGKSGKTQFLLNSYTGAAKITRKLDLMNTQQYLEMRREAFKNDGITDIPSYANDLNGTWDQNRYTDWQEELIGKTALTQSISAGLSGGNNNTQFIIRGTNYRESTVFPGDFSDRKSALHFKIDHKSDNNRVISSLSGDYVNDKNDLLATDLSNQAYSLAPNAPALYDSNGNLNWENSTWANPLRLLNQTYLAKTKNLTISGVLGYKLFHNLEVKSNFGFTDTNLEETRLTPSTIYDPAYGLTSSSSTANKNIANQNSWSIEPQISWNQNFLRKGNLNILAGATFQERNSSRLGLSASNFSSNSLINNFAAASRVVISGADNVTYRYNAVFGRINYNYDGKYIFNLTGRRDGSSRFGPGNRFSNFAAIGGAWLFHKEEFVNELIPFLSFGKLRSSYGTTGSDQIGDYQFLNTYGSSGISYQGTIGLQPLRLYNPNFSWETNKKLELAIDLGFLNDHIFFSLAHYRNRSSSQLAGIPLPGTTGFNSIQANLDATVQNIGWEFELRTLNFQDKKFRWSTSLNLTIPRNKLINFPNLQGSTYANQYVIGEPLGIRKLYNFIGVDSSTGLYKFEDYNNDGIISNLEDRQKIANFSPDYFGGLQNSLSYNNWELNFLFQYVKQQGINYVYMTGTPGVLGNQPVDVLDRWQQSGDTNPIQAYTAGFNNDALTSYSNFGNSTGIITDASFIRLKNVSLSYTLPSMWTEKVGCRVYLQAQNLLTITHFKGADPENQSFGRLPPLRVITIGAELTL